MKKYLLPETGNFYKANLHCHTTFSDGNFTPEEIKEMYKNQGYSIVAYTDHDIFIPHPELCDESFLALNSFEVEINEEKPDGTEFAFTKTCHICFIALDPENDIHPLWHRSKYLFSNAVQHAGEVKFDASLPDYERHYTAECISDMMRTGREKGFFVTYNHPAWSMEEYPQYMSYQNMNAMEIVNYESCAAGYSEHNERVYDDMLRGGKRIFCVATDDNHRLNGCFGGFTVIKAEKLDYKTITDALVKGDFYASEGPKITGLWYEDSKVHIECDGARRISIIKGIRRAGIVTMDDIPVTHAEFDIKEDDLYFRIVVEACDGKKAYTSAYFVDEL